MIKGIFKKIIETIMYLGIMGGLFFLAKEFIIYFK